MAVPTITKMQQTAQKMLDASKKQQAASTTATQSGSTSTPTVSSAPKVTSTPKAQPSVQQTAQTVGASSVAQIQQPSLKSLNLFKPQEQVQTAQQLSQQYGDLLSAKTENQDIQSITMPANTVRTAIKMGGETLRAVTKTLYEQGVDYAKQKLGGLKLKTDATKQSIDLFNNVYQTKLKSTVKNIYSGEGSYLSEIGGEIKKGEGPIGVINSYLQGIEVGGLEMLAGLSDLVIDMGPEKIRKILEGFGVDFGADYNPYVIGDWLRGSKEYYENTELAKNLEEKLQTPKGVLSNPGLPAMYMLGQMTPTLIGGAYGKIPGLANAVLGIYGQTYSSEYEDLSQDESLAGLSDEEIRKWARRIAVPSTIVEFAGDILEGFMPRLAPEVEIGQKEISRMLRRPITRIARKTIMGGVTEGFEEPIQTEIETRGAIMAGSTRELPTWKERFNNFAVSALVGLFMQGGQTKVNIDSHKELKKEYNDWKEIVGDLLEGVSEKEKKDLFAATVTYNIKNTPNAESKADASYNNMVNAVEVIKNELSKKLEVVKTEEEKTTLNNNIKRADEAITYLNQIKEEWDSVIEEVKQIQEKETEAQGQIIQKQEGGENLSKQTMDILQSSKGDVSRLFDSVGKQSKTKVMNEQIMNDNKKGYLQLIKDLGKNGAGGIKYAEKELGQYTYDSLIFMANDLRKRDGMEAYHALGRIESEIQNRLNEINKKGLIKKGFKDGTFDINDYQDIKELEKMGVTPFTETILKDLGLMKNIKGKHLWGVKGVNIKDLEGKITDEVARKYGQMLASTADKLGIDWNKVIKGMPFSFIATERKEDLGKTQGFIYPVYSKEDIIEYLKSHEGEDNLFTAGIVQPEKEATQAIIALIADGNETMAERIMAHEFTHLLDLRYAIDNNLKLEKSSPDNNGKVYIGFPGVLNGNTNFNTFNKGSETESDNGYWYQDKEVWSRYNEQLDAYEQFLEATNKDELTEEDKKIVDDYISLTEKEGYRSQNEFDKLLKEHNQIMREKLSDYFLDEENKGYSKIMSILNDSKFNEKLFTDREILENAKMGGEEGLALSNDVMQKIDALEKQYKYILEKIDKLSGDISEEVREGYDVALQDIKTNYDLAVKLKDKYVKITKNTKEQQKQLDGAVNIIAQGARETISDVNDVQEDGDIESELIENPDSKYNPMNIDINAPLNEQIGQIINKTIDASDKVLSKPKEKTVSKQMSNKKKKSAIKSVGDGFKDVFTPALSRLYEISPRLAGAVHTYEARKGLLTNGYKKLSLNFVKALDKLKKKNPEAYKKLTFALFDYGMVDTIDIKESLKEAGIDPKLFEPVAVILNQIALDYQEVGLDININDKYFPRKVRDYELLLNYLSRKAGHKIGETDVMVEHINSIRENPALSEGEKETKIRDFIFNTIPELSQKSNNAKERKLVLSEWKLTEEEKKQGYINDIIDFYEDPIVALDKYIDDMVKKTELRKMLGGLTKAGTAISEDFEKSIAGIIKDMKGRNGKTLTEAQIEEAKYVIRSIVNAKGSGPVTKALKNFTYSLTIANFISAAQQFDDLSKTLLAGPTGFKNAVKAVINKANIKFGDLGLENAFSQLEGGSVTDFLFKRSGFDMVDSMGKNSFINTAYDSCVKQANGGRSAGILSRRLIAMYGTNKGIEIFNKYKNKQLRDSDGRLDPDVMVDLLYQLGNTQPIYQSAMPTAYLNNPKIRLAYSLNSFTIKQMDWLIQGTKEVYRDQREVMGKSELEAATAAAKWCIGASLVVSLWSALISEIIFTLKGDEEETVRWNLINNGRRDALKQYGLNSLTGFLKIWNISKFDAYTWKREGIEGFMASKASPAALNIISDIIKTITGEKDWVDLGRYGPLFLKPLYYLLKSNDIIGSGGYGGKGYGTSGGSPFGKY